MKFIDNLKSLCKLYKLMKVKREGKEGCLLTKK